MGLRRRILALAFVVAWLGCAAPPEPANPTDYELQSGGAERPEGATSDEATLGPTTIAEAAASTNVVGAGAAEVSPDALPGSAPVAMTAVEPTANRAAASDAGTMDAAVAARATGADTDPGVVGTGSIAVEMTGFKDAGGQVLVALWRTGRGFPDDGSRAFGKKRTEVRGGTARVRFDGVPPGPFAVVAHHDEDRDFRMDTHVMGIPAEGYGFSRNASASFGPPSFEDARLWLAADRQRRVRIRMRY